MFPFNIIGKMIILCSLTLLLRPITDRAIWGSLLKNMKGWVLSLLEGSPLTAPIPPIATVGRMRS